MLKITVSNENSGTTFTLSGRLVGPWVQELRQCWLMADVDDSAQCRVDLRDVSFIDDAGKLLLSQMARDGVTIRAAGCLNRAIVEELNIPESVVRSTNVTGAQDNAHRCADTSHKDRGKGGSPCR
ncbi:MAG: hypothetical protein JSR62_04325 [Nitrospira sp.]|nr:hypothetical protein [Nitrospira sp.]